MMWTAFSVLLLVLGFYVFLSVYILTDIVSGFVSEAWMRHSEAPRQN